MKKASVVQIRSLRHISNGLTSIEVGEKLGISNRTVEKHIEFLMDLYKCKNTTHLVKKAIKKKIIKP